MSDTLSPEAALAKISIGDEANKTKLETTEEEPTRPRPPPLDDVIRRIGEGFLRFKTNEFDRYPEYFEKLADKQEPKFLVFACSDSRVCPSRILDFKPGEAFMARNIANMVPAFNQLRYSGTGAIIEYAVATLGVEVILVIGHSRCGGIKALLELPDDGSVSTDFVQDWIKIGLPARAKVKAEHPDKTVEELWPICERESVNFSLANILTYPYVKDKVMKRKVRLMGGHYDFVEGKFEVWDFHLDIKPPIPFPPPPHP